MIQYGGLILRDAAKWLLLTMRFQTLMVRSTAPPRVANHEAVGCATIIRSNWKMLHPDSRWWLWIPGCRCAAPAMTAIHVRIPAARSARVVQEFSPKKIEGAGKAGCSARTRSLAWEK
jgi:hypothetical protein